MNDNTYSAGREWVDAEERRRLEEAGVLSLDPRHTRPLWFDGRFLKAQDLNREQNYFLTRQGDLAFAAGSGVKEGLMVKRDGNNATSVIIQAGHGVTFGGDQVLIQRVVIPSEVKVDLADVPVIQSINARLGLSEEPAPPLHSLSGLFILALRPLEYTANPIASYPTHIDDSRSVEDGEIIEATAVTLVPFSFEAGFADQNLRRAMAADRIFVKGAEFKAPSSSLPLAMIELERGNVRWIDNHMVRRQMGIAQSDILGYGLAPRQLREAYFRQYEAHLMDVIQRRQSLGKGLRFPATEHFLSLPSAGLLPVECVEIINDVGTQFFFPAAINVYISIIPEDEIPALVEESMLLPPIELTASDERLASNSVLILVPIDRSLFYSQSQALGHQLFSLAAPISSTRTHLKPVEIIQSLRTNLSTYEAQTAPPELELSAAAWSSLVAGVDYLWFMRHRNLCYKDEIAGESFLSIPSC